MRSDRRMLASRPGIVLRKTRVLPCMIHVLRTSPRGRRAACMLSVRTSGRTAAPEVGTAVLIKPQVTGKLENEERRLETGSRVHRSELLKTGPQVQAELKLDDRAADQRQQLVARDHPWFALLSCPVPEISKRHLIF